MLRWNKSGRKKLVKLRLSLFASRLTTFWVHNLKKEQNIQTQASMMCKETPFTQNDTVMQQGDMGRFPMMPSSSKSATFALDPSAFQQSQLKNQTFTSTFPIITAANCNSDLYEPLPLAITSQNRLAILGQQQTRLGQPSFPSFITLANAKAHSLPEIQDDALLFDRLAEVCNLSRTNVVAKRAAPVQTFPPTEEPVRKRQRHVEEEDEDDSEDETSPRFR